MAELARILHDDQRAIQILLSKNRSRLTVVTLTKDHCNGWRASGVTPSFPSEFTSSVIAALVQVRDARAR